MAGPGTRMDSDHTPSPQGEEIIAAIRVKRSDPGSDRAPRRHPRQMAAAAAVLLIAALTGGGIWWIGYLSRHPLQLPAGPQQAETPPAPSVTAASEPLPPPPETSTAAVPSPAATPDEGKAEAVKQHVASAERWAAAGNLSAAQAELQEALRLDPQSQPALAGLKGVKSRMVEEDFRRWMAEGFAALNRDDFKTAQERFLKARALRPEAAEAREALTQTDVRQRSARIETLRHNALS